MFKKFQYISVVILVLAMLLSSCTSQETAAPTEEEPAVTAEQPVATEEQPVETEEPSAVSDVVIPVTAAGQSQTTFTSNFNPFSTTLLFPTQNGIYEPLMINNRIKGELVPWLATDYAWSDDILTLTFTLREGVKWSDGEDFTSADVVFTFDFLKSTPGLAGPGLVAVSEGGYIESVTAPDDYTVEFNFSRAYTPGFYDLIAQNIVPEHIWVDVDDPVTFTNDDPVGTGPFTEVVSFQDQVYQVDRNPNYWQPGIPTVQGLRMPGFSGNDTAATMFVNGDTWWTGQFFPNYEEAVISQNPEDLHCWWPAVTSDQFFMMNATKPPFDDPVVRKAISMAFNRDQLIEIAIQGTSTPGDVTGLSSGYAAWKVDDPASLVDVDWTLYNPDLANQMLDEAGYVLGDDGYRSNLDGSPIDVELIMVNGFSDWLAIAPLLKQSLEDIGFQVTINNFDPPVTFDKWFLGEFDMSLYFGIDADTPYVYYRNIMSAETFKPVGEMTGFGQNIWRVVIPEADEQLAVYASTGDVEVQNAAAVELQRIFAENAPVLPMWHAPTFYCYNDSQVTGWASVDNPFVRAMPIGANSTGEQLLQMVAWQPK